MRTIDSLKVLRHLRPTRKDILIAIFTGFPIAVVSLLIEGEAVQDYLGPLIPPQLTILGAFMSILIVGLSGLESTRSVAKIIQKEERLEKVIVFLSFSTLFTSLVYLASTGSFSSAVFLSSEISELYNEYDNIIISIAIGSCVGLLSISLGRLVNLVIDYMDLYADPTKTVDRLRKNVDLKKLSTIRPVHNLKIDSDGTPLTDSNNIFAFFYKHIIEAGQGNVSGYFEGIKGLKMLTLDILHELPEEAADNPEYSEALKTVADSWIGIISQIPYDDSAKIELIFDESHDILQDAYEHPPVTEAFDSLENILATATVGMVENEDTRFKKIGNRFSNGREKTVHEREYLLTQRKALSADSFEAADHHARAIDSVYRSLDSAMGFLNRDSQEACAIGIDAISLYGNIIDNHGEIADIGDKYEEFSNLREHVYRDTSSSLIQIVARDFNPEEPSDQLDRSVWIPGLLVLIQHSPEMTEQGRPERLLQAALEMALILEYDPENIAQMVAIACQGRKDRDEVIDECFDAILDPRSHSRTELNPWHGYASGLHNIGVVGGPNDESRRYESWIRDQRDSIEKIRTCCGRIEEGNLPPLVNFLEDEIGVHDELQNIITELCNNENNKESEPICDNNII